MSVNEVTRAAKPEEIARMEAQKQAALAEAEKPKPPAARIVPREGKATEQVVPLEYPVEYDGKIWESLTVRRVSGRDFQNMAEAGDDAVFLTAMLTGAPREVIEAMDGEDFIEVQGVVKAFLPRKLQAMAEQISGNGQNTQR